METYKIETSKNEIEILISALEFYKSEIIDAMLNALRSKNNKKFNSLNRRHAETRAILRKLQEINDPPF